jgi:hypothetical protein
MISTEQVNVIASRRAGGERLETIINSLGLPVQATLIDLRDNHREAMDAARDIYRQVQSLEKATASGAFVN